MTDFVSKDQNPEVQALAKSLYTALTLNGLKRDDVLKAAKEALEAFEALPTKTVDRFHVGIYHIDKAYGGPEEGGWWYNTGMLQPDREVRSFPTEELAREAAKTWNETEGAEANAGLPEISSVNSVGRLVARVYADELPEMFPTEIPRYE